MSVLVSVRESVVQDVQVAWVAEAEVSTDALCPVGGKNSQKNGKKLEVTLPVMLTVKDVAPEFPPIQ